MSNLAWHDIIAPMLEKREIKPRKRGVNMILDTGLGMRSTEDILEISGHLIDHWKMGFGTSAFVSADLIKKKNSMLAEHDVLTYPGGTLLEVALLEHHCQVYMQSTRELGFQAVEISDGTIPLPAHRRERIIQCAKKAGLSVITEVGKKDPQNQPTATELANQALQDFEWGADWVIVEGRESGISVGVYDDLGNIKTIALSEIQAITQQFSDRLIWEAPLKKQQTYLIEAMGANVSLGNVKPEQVLALEALRAGLRFETLHKISERIIERGDWKPDQIEQPEQFFIETANQLHPYNKQQIDE